VRNHRTLLRPFQRLRKQAPGSKAVPETTGQAGRSGLDVAWGRAFRKLAFGASGLMVFILALQVTKSGAQSAAPFVRDTLDVSNPLNALGFGWLFAYIVLSGSPVAATALALLSSETINSIETYAMIAGSRLGASFMVLMMGFLYVLRGHERRSGLAIGLLSLNVTASIYLPALVFGYVILESGAFDGVRLEFALFDALNTLFDPLVEPMDERLPGMALFALGIGLIVSAFALIDRALPDINLEERGVEGIARLLYKPPVMFAIGFAVTLVSLSVSVSLGLLVPLSARGLIRRENLIPYIMGCNVSTFIDTLVVAALLQSSEGFTVVLVEMLSVATVSILVLVVGYEYYERTIVWTVDWALTRNRNLAMFLAVFLIAPLLLMAL
jgi:Na+/phosphate symporter